MGAMNIFMSAYATKRTNPLAALMSASDPKKRTFDAPRTRSRLNLPQEMHNERLHIFVRAFPERTLLTSVCTDSWLLSP